MISIQRPTVYKIVYYFAIISFVIPMIGVSAKLVTLFSSENTTENSVLRTEYILMIVQAVLGIISINIPKFLMEKYSFDVPYSILILYTVFLFCAIYLGEIRRFYSHVDLWDDILHCFSSIMTGFFGFMLVYIINRTKDEKLAVKMSPIFVAMFAFCFSLTIGAVWEIYEFSLDHFMNLNMQKYRLDDGTALIGHTAVVDTMTDIIIDAIGSLLASVFGYFSIKRKRGWINEYLSGEES